MKSQTNMYQFRPVPLRQREDIMPLGGRTSPRDGRRRREDEGFPREHVSAYLGESEVVSVTRRSERSAYRASSQLRLVPAGNRMPAGRTYAPEDAVPRTQRRREPIELERDARHPRGADYRGEREGMSRRERAPRRVREDRVSAARRRPRRSGGLVGAVRALPGATVQGLGAAVSHTNLVLFVATLALIASMLFVPVRNLYVAHRRLDTLQATYAALEAENASIRNELEVLQTREGIENEARARGYVTAGETKVVVDGLPEDDSENDGAASAVAPLEVPDTRPWYIKALDTLFGYDPEA